MITVCEENKCAGCMACLDICASNAITIADKLKTYSSIIDENKCVDCGLCRKVCPSNEDVSKLAPISWYQGWATQEEIRKNGSSGGIATAIATAFVNNGGIVCSCVFNSGNFCFDIVDNANGINRFSGSKYVKSNPVGAYKRLKKEITLGKRALFIGLPCQVAAVKKYIGSHKNLYTIDLICHGTPSPKLLDKYLNENKRNLSLIKDLKFRKKVNYKLFDSDMGIKPSGVQDRYTYAFLNSVCYTENCYSCRYACRERVSDVTLGDSWGNTLSKEEQEKGVSLILCQSSKGEELLSKAELHLEDVDLDKAILHNKQLEKPSKKPFEHGKFYRILERTGNFSRAVKKCYPKFCLKQDIKAFLVKTKIFRRG